MNNSVFHFDVPQNEPILEYAPASLERQHLQAELARQAAIEVEIPLVIGGEEVRTGRTRGVVMPCEHGHVLAQCHLAGKNEVGRAVKAALAAHEAWSALSWIERASIMLKAAELLSKDHRLRITAATMLGQGKSVHQAEIDAACETIDYQRYNVYFASQIYAGQPRSTIEQLNRMEYRPLEGFVFAVSPFNFTAIASNLNMAVALMGNTTVWKPASTAVLSNYYLMRLLMEAGLPPGVVNFVPGAGELVGRTVLEHPRLSGIHFTGSNATFNHLWRSIAENLPTYRSYPRIVGETGGKDFIFAHASADPLAAATAMVRGAFEYQGQKCSAASRAYVPASLWPAIRDAVVDMVSSIRVGDVRDFGNFVNAVIDEASFDNTMRYIALARSSEDARILCGGDGDKAVGYFVQPTVIEVRNPRFVTMEEEIFGPVLSVFVYDDARWTETLHLCDATSPYALTGAIFCRDRYAFIEACRILRYAAGNFYINDKPTGAMVGLQPFGGARCSGTNDKAGGPLNLLRWISPRTIKETFLPPTSYEYPFMG
ncbi:MAG: L-glutamate gamma-semialdehyde dehydrogenase [Proteobacteria bacterium]|jgi:1-pyrroline-5-carboxylate dehydrogenase|nr:L-glutamate gamma-semialdehyde dehydrogenase [Pseudomonadota bacterium]